MKQRYRILTVLLFFVAISVTAFAQRTVSGTIKDSQGNGLPGVNVIVKGTTTGTTSDSGGKYTISVPDGSNILVFSFIGFSAKEAEIGNQSNIDITLTEDVTELGEVVVTALGIQRSTKALQYSMTQVSGENFTQARENNLGNSLYGRVAGVNVSKPSTGPAGSTRIIIRGTKTLSGNNQPLYVVDGIPMDNSNFGQAGLWGGRDSGDGLTSLSPDDIESITVLKGANAAALYGSRGGYGVINIVTKRGSTKKGIGVEVNSNYVFETVNNLSDLQHKYGSGNYLAPPAQGLATFVPVATKAATPPAGTAPQQAFNWGADSWGPALDGSDVVQFDGVARPYSYAGDNFKRFYEKGSAWTNSIALTGGGENQTFRFSVANMKSTSVVPNSGFDRLNASLSVLSKFGKKLSLDAKVMYSHEDAMNRPTLSDSPGNAIQAVWRLPPSVNLFDLKGDPNKLGAIPLGYDPVLLIMQGGGSPASAKIAGQELLPWNNIFLQNPYWSAYQFMNEDIRDRVITSGQLRYNITDAIYASGRIGMDWFARKDVNLTPEGTAYTLSGSMSEGQTQVREINMEWMLGFNKNFGNIGVNSFIGGNRMRASYERVSANGTGFSVQFFPALNNAAARSYGYSFNERGINSLFASAEVDYKSLVFLTATARNDWFSVLNPEYNNVFYPSVGASFVFSDAFQSLPSWMSFGKFRASWAQVGLAAQNPYEANLTYSLSADTHLTRPLATFSSAFGTNGNIPNPKLQPSLSTEIEFGFDVRLFDNKIGLDVTYYSQKTTDDILRASISRSSGFGSTNINVGELTNKGVEVLLTATPVKGPLTWDVSVNFAKNKNEVVSLVAGLTEVIGEEPRTRNVFIKHIQGYPYGMITGRRQLLSPDGQPVFVGTHVVVGGVIQRDASGNPIVQSGGLPLSDPKLVPLGNGIANWTGGINNSLTFKGINLTFLFDFKVGGDIVSGTNMRLTSWGLHQQSLIGRDGEKPMTISGVVRVPVVDAADKPVLNEAGQPVYEYRPLTNTVYQNGTDATGAPIWVNHTGTLIPNQARSYWNSVQGETNPVPELFMYDASFVKLRQLTLGYSIPRTWLSKTPLQNLTVSFVGRNLAILKKNIENVDPESAYSSNGGAQGLEYFAVPPTRSYGFNIRAAF